MQSKIDIVRRIITNNKNKLIMKKIYKFFFLLVLLELNAGGLWAQNDFTALQGMIDGTPNEGTLVLSADYTATSGESRISISGKSITLDLNGHVINRNLSEATANGNVIYIASDATLTIVDSNPTATHNPAITYTNPNGNEPVTVNGGILMGGCNDSNGGCVYNAGTFNLNGGTITKNSVITAIIYNGGGGVYNSGAFTMDGVASVSGNVSQNIGINPSTTSRYASCGGGIYNYGINAIFTLVSGTISNNEIPNGERDHDGGGVYNANGALFQMNGGVISGNVVPSVDHIGSGGGVYNMHTNSRFILTAGSIDHNTARFGGGVENSGTFTMEGGTISYNTGCNFGGGVTNSSGIFNFIDGSITNNSSNYGAGGIYLVNGGSVTMTGGTVSDNSRDGVRVNSTFAVFYFEDGVISSNVDEGVVVNSNGTCNMSGGQVLSNGSAGVQVSYGKLNMSGGEIRENSGTGMQLGYYSNNLNYSSIVSISGGTFENNYTSSSSGEGKGIRVYQGTLNLSDNPTFGTNQDICLYCTKTSDDDSNGYRAVITKAGDITSVNAIPVTVGYNNRTNLYDGRNIIESGAGTVTQSDYSKFNILNQTAYNNLLIIDRYTAQDEGTGDPVIELHDLAACWEGSGTQADPYKIVDAADLVCLATEVNAGTSYAGIYFQMTQNIDLSSVCGASIGNWTPIGYSSPFRGYFDGGNHTITGLYINGLNDYQGLFGVIADGAQVNNLTLGESTISGNYFVGLVGAMDVNSGNTVPSINNCTTLSSVNVTGYKMVGGICGYSHGSFSNCTNNATIVGNRVVSNPGDSFDLCCAGGIVGASHPQDYRIDVTGAYAVSMTNCTNNGSVTAVAFTSNGEDYYAIAVGGIGGLLEGVVSTGCTNTAQITGTAVTGGISGGTDGNVVYPSKFIQCNNSGAVTAIAIVGGISGDNDGTTNESVYDNCHNTGALSSHFCAGGIIGRYNTNIGYNDGETMITSPVIRNCSNSGDVVLEGDAFMTWIGNAGGIAGMLTDVDIENSTNTGDVTANTGYAGGLVAKSENNNVSHCHNEGNVQITDTHVLTIEDLQNVLMTAGGLVGMTFNSTITSSYNTGNVSGGVFSAGIVGFIDSRVEAISNCFNLGVVESNTQMGFAGGIVGNFSVEDGVLQSTMGIKNCYNAGPLIGHGAAGGIAAFSEANVKDCYNVGYLTTTPGGVQGLSFNGHAGIVGTFNSDNGIIPDITNCYYDKQMCPAEYDYMRIDLSTFTFTPHTADGDNLLTTSMIGSGLNLPSSEWSFVDGLYPQLKVFLSRTNTIDTEASLVSVNPMFLANEENVDLVLTSPFTVGTNSDLEWIHVDGSELLTFNNAEVTWSNYGTETVAVRHTTDTQIQKLIRVKTSPELIADGFWPDVVTAKPDGYVVVDESNISINSVDGLAWLISVVNGYNGQTAANLQGKTVTIDATQTYDMGAHYWVPINSFSGTFTTSNGEEVTIDRIYLPQKGISTVSSVNPDVTYWTGANYSGQGLFGHIVGGTVENVIMGENSVIVGYSSVGGICGYMEGGTIEHCTNLANVGGINEVGGILGYGYSTTGDISLIGCTNSGTLTNTYVSGSKASNRFGGIVGSTSGQITDCHNTADLYLTNKSEDSKRLGGIVGYYRGFSGKSILSCSNTGNITADGEIGGICGAISGGSDILIDQCFNTGNITGNAEFEDGEIGGICASFYDGTISNCYNTGNLTLEGFSATGGDVWASGGICAEIEDATIENCYNTGSVSGILFASGIVVEASNSTVSGCYNTGDITSIGIDIDKDGGDEEFGSLAAGIVAYADHSTITDCNNSGAVSFNNTSIPAYVAGICASMSNESSVTKCHNSGNVIVKGETGGNAWTAAGGIVATDGEGQNSVVTYCSNDGDVTSNYFASGIWADLSGDVLYSYNTGTIRGVLAGGIAANAESGNERVINCFNTGNIIGVSAEESPIGASMVGGLLGQCIEGSKMTNCYNTGMVVGYGAAGGLACSAEHDCAENCYNAGQVICHPIGGSLQYGGGLIALIQQSQESPASITHCYYDKQMCTQVNAYNNIPTGKSRDIIVDSFLTTEMLGDNMRSLFGTENDAWIYESGLYPRLAVFDNTSYFPNNDASITSVSPVHLVYTDGTTYEDVDNVTSSFTLRYGDTGNEGSHPVYWEHDGNGSSLYTDQINYGRVGISATGNDTLVAMKNGAVYKTVVFHAIRPVGETWVDVVVAEPDGYNDLDINSPEDLAWFCSRVNGFNGEDAHPYLNGRITADIDLSAHYWVPIGLYAENINHSLRHTYNSTFHGNHHNIDGVNIDFNVLKASPTVNPGGNKEINVEGNRDTYDYLGFFGRLGSNAAVKDVVLSSGTIVGATENHSQVMGGIAGAMEGGVIRACVSNVKLTRFRFDPMGGIVGECEGSYEGGKEHPEGELKEARVLNCTSTAELEGYGWMGGIAGTAEGVVISNCYANAKFTVQSSGSKADSFESYVGGIVGGCYLTELSNCYVRLRDDSNYGLTKDGGGEEHLFGLFIGRAEEETVKHCYVPENTGYPYIGMAETENYMFVKATSLSDVNPSQSKGDTRYMFITTQQSEGNYYLMPFTTPFDVSSTEQSSTYDTYEILPQYDNDPAWVLEGYLDYQGYYIRYDDNWNYLKYDSNNGTLILEAWNENNTNMYWDVEQFPNETTFKMSNKNYPNICLALHNNGNGTFTFGAYDYSIYGDNPDYNFHISFFMETEIPTNGNLYGCGTFGAPTYPYTYNDPRGGSIVTLGNADEDDYATSGETTLLDALNNWVVGNYVGTEGFDTYVPDPDWARFGSALNSDYPVHCYYEPKNIQPADANAHEGGDEFSPSAKVVVTTDKAKGYPFRYYHHVSDALAYCNGQSDGGIVCVYGSDDMRNADTQENDANVDVYVNGMTYMQCDKLKSGVPYTYYTFFGDNAAAKSTDWYVSLLQDNGKKLTVTTGFNLDNSDATDFAGANYDWHMVSSPLKAIPVGIDYTDEVQHGLNDLPVCTWNNTADGLFPKDTPYNSFDFYAYSEPNYHWMNFKRNSNSHWYQDTGEHIENYENDEILVPGHGYLIALDKELFMQAKGELNNGDVEVEVTNSGAHNTGLNYLGNPYQSSLDFEAFVTENTSLWSTEESDYYQSYLILDADAHCYKYYVKTQSDNPDLPSRYIWPFQGFYVGVDAEGTATFKNAMRVIGVDKASYMHKSGSDKKAYPLVNLIVTDAKDKSDMFTVELGRPEWGGGRKEKDMTAGSGVLWSNHEDKEYSVLFSGAGVQEIPVRFTAKETGTFTMTWSHYNGDFSYLHLIDNMTGVDIDCLTTDSYSFEGKTDDYQSRFKLVFGMPGEDDDDDDDGASTSSEIFAFMMGDELVVNGEGLLQVFDMNGRQLVSTQLHGAQSTVSLPTVANGVYLMHLTNDNQVKTQKMVINK